MRGEGDYMGVCPYCNRELDSLLFRAIELHQYNVYINGNEILYDEVDVDTEDGEFCCPYCKRIITYSEKEAIKFLSK